MMQQSMQMAQQMFGGGQAGLGAGFPGALGAPAFPAFSAHVAPPTLEPQAEAGQAPAMPDALARATFAAQLAQLSAMGFCNEAACLRALQQHQGRVDAAIDALLSSGDS